MYFRQDSQGKWLSENPVNVIARRRLPKQSHSKPYEIALLHFVTLAMT